MKTLALGEMARANEKSSAVESPLAPPFTKGCRKTLSPLRERAGERAFATPPLT